MNFMDTKLAEWFSDKPFWQKGLVSSVVWMISWYICYFVMPYAMGLAPIIPIIAGIIQFQILQDTQLKVTVGANIMAFISSKIIWFAVSMVMSLFGYHPFVKTEQAFTLLVMVMFYQMVMEILVMIASVIHSLRHTT